MWLVAFPELGQKSRESRVVVYADLDLNAIWCGVENMWEERGLEDVSYDDDI